MKRLLIGAYMIFVFFPSLYAHVRNHWRGLNILHNTDVAADIAFWNTKRSEMRSFIAFSIFGEKKQPSIRLDLILQPLYQIQIGAAISFSFILIFALFFYVMDKN